MKKKCKSCGNKYERLPEHPPFRCWCSTECAIQISRAAQDKQRAKQLAKQKRDQKAYRKETRARKLALKTVRDWIKGCQPIFNKFIRLRDYPLPCISCGRTNEEVELTDGWKPGGAWDCGHFLTVGGFPELRFEESNAHKQCKSCNGGSGKYTRKNKTVGTEYERRLRARIGDEQVDWLQGPHEPKKYTIEDIKEIKAEYRKKSKDLQEQIDEL